MTATTAEYFSAETVRIRQRQRQRAVTQACVTRHVLSSGAVCASSTTGVSKSPSRMRSAPGRRRGRVTTSCAVGWVAGCVAGRRRKRRTSDAGAKGVHDEQRVDGDAVVFPKGSADEVAVATDRVVGRGGNGHQLEDDVEGHEAQAANRQRQDGSHQCAGRHVGVRIRKNACAEHRVHQRERGGVESGLTEQTHGLVNEIVVDERGGQAREIGLHAARGRPACQWTSASS